MNPNWRKWREREREPVTRRSQICSLLGISAKRLTGFPATDAEKVEGDWKRESGKAGNGHWNQRIFVCPSTCKGFWATGSRQQQPGNRKQETGNTSPQELETKIKLNLTLKERKFAWNTRLIITSLEGSRSPNNGISQRPVEGHLALA